MPKGAFIVSQDKTEPRDIRFDMAGGAPDPKPEDQLALKDEIDETLRVLSALYPPGNSAYEKYFRPLLSLAQAGLVGDHADPAAAHRALISLRHEITNSEAGRVKNAYMRELGKYAIRIGGPALIAAVVLWFGASNYQQFASFLFLWAGTMAGVWLSFGVRKSNFAFEDLVIPEQDRVEPAIRLVFTGLLSIIIGLLFALKMVTVTFGSVSTDAFVSDLRLALLIGLLCGFSETALPTKVAQHATKLLDLDKSK